MGEAGRWGAGKGWVEGGDIGACPFRDGETEAERGDMGGLGATQKNRVSRRRPGLLYLHADVGCFAASQVLSPSRVGDCLSERPPPPHKLLVHF